jgi:hypothetical protein
MNPETKKPLGKRILRGLSIGVVAVIAIFVVAHFVWKQSGDNQWKLEKEKRGVKVYSRKSPGSSLKDWKAVRKVELTLNRAVAGMMSTESEDCAAWAPSCVSVKAIQPWNAHNLSYVQLYRVNYPKPFSPREIVIDAKGTQDPKSKAVVVAFVSRPDAVPENECCVRLGVYEASWHFIPAGAGELEIQLHMHADPGIPYVLVNALTGESLYRLFTHLPRLLTREKFQNAKFEGIQEL